MDGVSVRRDDTVLLDRVDWQVEPGQRWVVLGPNGSGKSTLLRLAALHLHPSEGAVHVLGETLGHTDTRVLRRRIGYAAAALADSLRPGVAAAAVVMTALLAIGAVLTRPPDRQPVRPGVPFDLIRRLFE